MSTDTYAQRMRVWALGAVLNYAGRGWATETVIEEARKFEKYLVTDAGSPGKEDRTDGKLVSYDALPLGARFKYPNGSGDVWVKLRNGECGMIAEWKGPELSGIHQSLCTFEDSPDARERGVVLLAEEGCK